VGKRRNSVFLMPPRAVWKREDNTWYDDFWEQANQRCQQLTRDELSPDGYGLSRQTWGLHVKLREANECLATDCYAPNWDSTHPQPTPMTAKPTGATAPPHDSRPPIYRTLRT
jgi:hypothetical protein